MGSNSAIYDPCIAQPNVQEMVRLEPFQLPERYIRNRNDTVLHSELSGEDIPTIDLSLLVAENEKELHKLDLACKEWDFCQIVNHSVAKEVTKNMKDSAKRFLDLPLEERNKIAMPPNDIQGYGHSHSDEILDWSDKLDLIVYPHQYRKLEFWPPSPFRVVTNESKARISYATFYIPRHDADIEPLDQMVLESPGSIPLYKKVVYGAYLKHTQKTTKEGKEHLTEFTTIAS